MREVDFFQVAFDLSPPWEVVSCEFPLEKKRLDIRLAFPRGSVFVYPECGQTGLTAYDTTDKAWRHLNFFQQEARLTAKVPRVKRVAGQRIHPALRGSGHEPGSSDAGQNACREIGECDSRIGRMFLHCMDEPWARQSMSALLFLRGRDCVQARP